MRGKEIRKVRTGKERNRGGDTGRQEEVKKGREEEIEEEIEEEMRRGKMGREGEEILERKRQLRLLKGSDLIL